MSMESSAREAEFHFFSNGAGGEKRLDEQTADLQKAVSNQRNPNGRDELRYRLRQHSLLADFGRSALQTRDIQKVLHNAADLCAQGLEAGFAKVLEYIPDENRLLVRAGVGWKPGVIDSTTLGADLESPAGYAYQSGNAVISNHLQAETRFRTPVLLADHGVRRAINVLIERGGENNGAFGVLEVDSSDPGQFDRADADFLFGFAGLLGIAIERQNADVLLQEAVNYQALLTREMSHRVKNSLSIAVGLLHIQARNTQLEEVKTALDDAASRVGMVAQVHDHLWQSRQIGFVELADFIGVLCKKMDRTAQGHTVLCRAATMTLSADQAIPLGLLINELVTNAVKHAYPEAPGEIHVSAHGVGGRLYVEISDQGIGLPEGFNIDLPRASLGFKVVNGLVRQLNGTLKMAANEPTGARFRLDMPVKSRLGAVPQR